MEKICPIRGEYLYLPVCAGREERKLEIFLKSEGETPEKIFEFMVPVDGTAAGRYVCDFYAQIPVRQYQGREFLICWGDLGVGNFFINREALKRRDFSRVLYNWDCG